MNFRIRTPRRGAAPALAAVLAAAVGVVGGHLIWTSGASEHQNATANTSNPFRRPLGGGVRGGCTSSGCSFNFGGSGFGSGPGASPGSGAGFGSGGGAPSG